LNVAWHVRAVVSVTAPSLQSASPLHPPNVDPAAGVAVNVTAVPDAYGCVQSVPQLIPAGLLVTVPLPVPPLVTVNMTVGCTSVKFAVTLLGAVIVTEHAPVPAHDPLQLANAYPAAGAGVNCTTVALL
jgi:hypothetical protein